MAPDARNVVLVLVFSLIANVAGCEYQSKTQQLAQDETVRIADDRVVQRGANLFAAHCASCHGELAEGDVNWRELQDDGKYPPPPLNGTGHAWHHSKEVLRETIKNGTLPQGNMPGWKGKLSDHDVDALIAWFQSLWADDVYEAWQSMMQERK